MALISSPLPGGGRKGGAGLEPVGVSPCSEWREGGILHGLLLCYRSGFLPEAARVLTLLRGGGGGGP